MEKIQVLVCHWRGNVLPAAVVTFSKPQSDIDAAP